VTMSVQSRYNNFINNCQYFVSGDKAVFLSLFVHCYSVDMDDSNVHVAGSADLLASSLPRLP